MDTDRH